MIEKSFCAVVWRKTKWISKDIPKRTPGAITTGNIGILPENARTKCTAVSAADASNSTRRYRSVSLGFSVPVLSPFTIAVKSVSNSFAIRSRVSTSGVAILRSQLETAWRVTPIFSANCSCDSPCFLRRATILSARFLLTENTSFLSQLYYTWFRLCFLSFRLVKTAIYLCVVIAICDNGLVQSIRLINCTPIKVFP